MMLVAGLSIWNFLAFIVLKFSSKAAKTSDVIYFINDKTFIFPVICFRRVIDALLLIDVVK